jgi:DHA2 family multidrug resistance protein
VPTAADTTAPAELSGLRLGLASLAVALASFMNVLDTTIAVVALPTIAGNLAATPSQSSWVITSYSVCLAVVLPLSGWITRRFGEVRTFCTAVLLFTLTSWLCASARSFDQLLLFRALQGFSGGLLLPLSQSLLLRIYPPSRHGLALAIWSLTSAVAPVAGPLLGGWLTDTAGWPWIFYVNVPIGLFAAYTAWSLLHHMESPRSSDPVDAVGLVLLVVGVICFQLVLDRGHELDWLASGEIRVMLGVSLVCLVLFLVWESAEVHPVVDLSLFRHRGFLVGTVLVSLFFAAFVVSGVVYPMWTQTALGYTATASGVAMAPTSLLPLVMMPLVGQRLAGVDKRPVILLGSLVMSGVMFGQAWAGTDATFGDIALSRFLIGLGMPLMWMPLMMATLMGLPAEKTASATGMFNFVRMAASSMGTALAVTVWDERTIVHRSQLVELLSRGIPEVDAASGLLAARLADPQAALAALEAMVWRQAYTLGVRDVFILCALVMIIVGVCAWLLPGRGGAAPAPVVAHD